MSGSTSLNLRIFVAGHRGLVGSALMRALVRLGSDPITVERRQLDLRDESRVSDWFSSVRPDAVILAAARVGGILANATYPAEFLLDNLRIQNAVIDAAYRHGVGKLVFLGSSCIYPKFAAQPIVEDSLMTGVLESTNEAYAIAKIAGIKLCQAFRRQYGFDAICLMPTNLYGPNDNFDPVTSHVLPAMIKRFHDAKELKLPSVTIWGTGKVRREFLHVDDLAEACIFALEKYSDERVINVGVGEDITIMELARVVAEVVGYDGDIKTNPEMPDGTPRKVLDVHRLAALGWRPRISLTEGIASTYKWYVESRLDGNIGG